MIVSKKEKIVTMNNVHYRETLGKGIHSLLPEQQQKRDHTERVFLLNQVFFFFHFSLHFFKLLFFRKQT